jgi:hypothetical protein
MSQSAKRLTYRVDMPGGQDRLREMILYVADKAAGMPRFGKVKLNKILWKADFDAFAERRMPVTGRAYQKLKAGPAPIEMPPILAEMSQQELIEIQPRTIGNFVEERIIAKSKANLYLFSTDDVRYVDRAIAYFWDLNARTASDVSHGVAWATREELDPMPYELSFLSDHKLSGATLSRVKAISVERGWKSA